MLIRQGTARSSDIDRRLACTLAAIAGALNAAAFHAVGFFSANMTGNVSSLSDHIALGEWRVGAFYLMIVLAFIGGGAVSTPLVKAARRRGRNRLSTLSILAATGLLILFWFADPWVPPNPPRP